MVMIDNPLRSRTFKRTNKSNAPYSLRKDHFLYYFIHEAIPTKIAATSTTTIQSMIQIDSNLTDTSDNNDLNNQVLAKPLRHSFNQYNKNIPPTIILQRLHTILSFINPQQNSLRTNSRSNFSTNNINKNTVGGSRSNSSAWSVSNGEISKPQALVVWDLLFGEFSWKGVTDIGIFFNEFDIEARLMNEWIIVMLILQWVLTAQQFKENRKTKSSLMSDNQIELDYYDDDDYCDDVMLMTMMMVMMTVMTMTMIMMMIMIE
ncbi:hypothetical protein Glove_54g121 [Diversispora epigaea]|uniref:Uncharacterized protein n=1 Tax=Diversispora epigaea TaxID=1348612 RepID=A0A397JMM8_9GLOM|nr:hypothetical protein Glove_54g121 [Diversispora epigaea]